MEHIPKPSNATSTVSRRRFLSTASATLAATAITTDLPSQEQQIQGFDETNPGEQQKQKWEPISDRKIKVGIVGHGVCKFGAKFGFQNHPNVEVVAVSDLFPDRCAELAKACHCKRTFPSLEKMVKDDSIEAIFLATDAPNHAKHAMLCLKHGKHVGCAVPAVWETVEQGEELFAAVKASKRSYMMFETSAFRPDCYAMRQAYNAGALGKLIYSEGQYYHYFAKPIGSYKNWRDGLPPMWYPTHSTAYYVAVTGKSFTHVSCQGFEGSISQYKAESNRYGNPFDSEIALFRTSEGGASRMSVCWGTRGSHGEYGHVRGEKAQMEGTTFSPANDLNTTPVEMAKPPLPPGMPAGGHGGSHGYLTEEFINSILQKRDPLINVAWSLNMTVPGIIAHRSALKNGELLKVPQFMWPT
jgi:predicted dehydrogenase